MHLITAAVSCVAAVCAACSDPATVESPAGSYVATSFTVREGSTTEDMLSAGASIDVTLTAARTTSGRLFVPDGSEQGRDLDADLTGSWSLDSCQVTLAHAADTFLRDMPFTVDSHGLVGEATFGGARLRVVLERQ